MDKFKTEHPDYFKILQKNRKEPRQPQAIYKEERIVEFSKSHPKVKFATFCVIKLRF